MIMKKIFNIVTIFLLTLLGTSCLKDNLSGKYNSTHAEMTDFRLFYKYQDTTIDQQGTKNEVMRIAIKAVQLNSTMKVDSAAGTLQITPTLPSDFPQKYRRKVSLTRLWGVAYISSAAIIAPLNGSPALGTPGDYSKPVTYEITSPAGNRKTWTVTVEQLPVINQYEGSYHSKGRFAHPDSEQSRDFDIPDKYLNSRGANRVVSPHSDLGSSGYTIVIEINTDNTCKVTQYDDSGATIGEMTQGEINQYYPAEKKFILHYRFMVSGAYRTINETLTLNN